MALRTIHDCIDLALTVLSADVRERFMHNPIGTMEQDLDLTVQDVPDLAHSRADGGACDGTTFLSDGVVLYAQTEWSRRENFTLAHELGHWLVDQAPEVYNWLANQDEPGKMLETVCDLLAQRLLLPDKVLRSVIGDVAVRAHHINDLVEASLASPPVAAIALADHLPNLGAVAIISRDTQQVTTASVHPDPDQGWPRVFPWPGNHLNATDPLLQMAPRAHVTLRRTWRTPWGTSDDFYIDAVADRRHIYVVFSSTDLWDVEKFHSADTRAYDTRLTLTGTCCGETFEARGYPCPTCRKPYCPTCNLCVCQKRETTEQLCAGSCFMKLRPSLLQDGLCEECR